MLKVGSDLFVETGSDSGAIIKGFFKSTYDPAQPYTYMGITIPKDDATSDDPTVTGDVSNGVKAAMVKMSMAARNAVLPPYNWSRFNLVV